MSDNEMGQVDEFELEFESLELFVFNFKCKSKFCSLL